MIGTFLPLHAQLDAAADVFASLSEIRSALLLRDCGVRVRARKPGNRAAGLGLHEVVAAPHAAAPASW